jgi:membrane protein involved in colicin uptake
MKKWMYVISVGSMLAIFLVLYFAETKKHDERERVRAAEVAKKKADEDARKAAIEAAAKADADKRAAQRAADEAKKEADRVAKWEAEGQKIKDATDKYNAEADRSARKAAALELQLTDLRAQKEKLNREAFDLTKQVELGKINRRTAEMEIQRITAMIATKATQSSLARPPAVVAPPSS